MRHVVDTKTEEWFHMDENNLVYTCDCKSENPTMRICISLCPCLKAEGELNEIKRSIAIKRKELKLLEKGKNTISIVIPSYNQAQYLRDAIESALNQNAHEIIVVDDGSTDDSLNIAKSYGGIEVISQVNKGLASARNTGIMNATGDYILFLDADDILMDNCVKKITETIKQTNADIVAPSFRNFGLDNSFVILGDPTLEDFKTANRIGYFSAVKRDALLEIGGYSPRMTWGAEDLHLWINLLSKGKKLVTIKEPLVMYRIKEQSMWTETQKHQEEFMNQIKKDFNI